jgi:hypothetical protein
VSLSEIEGREKSGSIIKFKAGGVEKQKGKDHVKV